MIESIPTIDGRFSYVDFSFVLFLIPDGRTYYFMDFNEILVRSIKFDYHTFDTECFFIERIE